MRMSKSLRSSVNEVASFYGDSFDNLPHRAKYLLLTDFIREKPEYVATAFIADNPHEENFQSALIHYLENQHDKDAQIEILDALRKCIEHSFKDTINDALVEVENDQFISENHNAGLNLIQRDNGDQYWGRL